MNSVFKGGAAMPRYEYLCENCNKTFEVIMSMEEHEGKKVSCPECKKEQVVQQFSTFYSKTSKKS